MPELNPVLIRMSPADAPELPVVSSMFPDLVSECVVVRKIVPDDFRPSFFNGLGLGFGFGLGLGVRPKLNAVKGSVLTHSLHSYVPAVLL